MINTVTSFDIHQNIYQVPIEELIWRPATYGIIINNDKILLTKQHGKFHLPGGGLELGEMPEEGVIREVKEETGLDVINPRLIDSISGFFTFTSLKKSKVIHVQSILFYYVCELLGGEISIEGFDENEKQIGEMPEWISVKDLDTVPAGSTVDWRDVVKRYINK